MHTQIHTCRLTHLDPGLTCAGPALFHWAMSPMPFLMYNSPLNWSYWSQLIKFNWMDCCPKAWTPAAYSPLGTLVSACFPCVQHELPVFVDHFIITTHHYHHQFFNIIIEPRASHIQGSHSTDWTLSMPLFTFWDRVSLNFLGWPWAHCVIQADSDLKSS